MPSALVPSVGTDWRLEKERRPLVVHGFLGTGAAWESGRYLFRWSRRKRKVREKRAAMDRGSSNQQEGRI